MKLCDKDRVRSSVSAKGQAVGSRAIRGGYKNFTVSMAFISNNAIKHRPMKKRNRRLILANTKCILWIRLISMSALIETYRACDFTCSELCSYIQQANVVYIWTFHFTEHLRTPFQKAKASWWPLLTHNNTPSLVRNTWNLTFQVLKTFCTMWRHTLKFANLKALIMFLPKLMKAAAKGSKSGFFCI